nr:uncharacterized protein LOC107411075 isoform X1 [Ziziphus jujuba var. spinosa]
MLVRSVCQNTTSSMHKLMLNMGRQTLIYLLLAWLLLAAYPRHYSTVSVQAIESAHFKLKPAQPNSRSGRFVFPAWVSRRVEFLPKQNNHLSFLLRSITYDYNTLNFYSTVAKQVDGKKIHKAPSGPNPVGNHRPPSKH